MLMATQNTADPHFKSGNTPNCTSFNTAFFILQFFKNAEVKLTPIKSASLKSVQLRNALHRFASGIRILFHCCLRKEIYAVLRIVIAFEAAYLMS